MRVAVLATGGKDSTLALYRMLQQGYTVDCLVSMFPLRDDSWMFHYPNIRLMNIFAEAVDIPLKSAETSGVKDAEIQDLKNLLQQLDVDAIVTGAIASVYQKNNIEKICNELQLTCISPLWNNNPIAILDEIISLKFEVIITGLYAYGLNRKWLGRVIDPIVLEELIELNKKYAVSVVGEGGEYETLVVNAPFFKKKIKIIEKEEMWTSQSGFINVKKVILESK